MMYRKAFGKTRTMTTAAQIASGVQRILPATLRKQVWRETAIAYLFLLPFLVLYSIFAIIPIVQGFWISLHNWEIVGTNIRFVGLGNYQILLQDKLFWSSLWQTIYFVVLSGPSMIILGLILALLLNRRIPGIGGFRTIFYLPSVLSVTVIGLIFGRFFTSDPRGFINALIAQLGLDPIPFLHDPRLAMPVIALTSLWWSVGFNMLIFLAGLQDIPEELYEAAKVDGANRWALFRHVTLPGLSRPMTFVVILQIIGSFQVFGQVSVMTGGGPAGATRTIVFYIWERAFYHWQLGYGAAIAFVLFGILLVISLVQLKFFSRQGDQS
jgi:multiple sugar transport system permease protein